MGAAWVAHAEARPYPAQAVAMYGTRWEPPATLAATAGVPFSSNATGVSIEASVAVQNPAKAPPGTTAAASTEDRNPSTIPTPVDNPWALGLLAALAVVMLWMDWSQRRDRV
jgi:hypothetical protein